MNPTTPKSDERNGSWIDKFGACVCCDGEIPHGHSDNCDIYKAQLKLDALKAQNEGLVKALESLKQIKHWCLTSQAPLGAMLSRILRICIDAGITQSYKEIESEWIVNQAKAVLSEVGK